jgi:hypothetical protein
MLGITQSDLDLVLSDAGAGIADSNLGFFSKPYRIDYKSQQLIVKKYLPVRDAEFVSGIVENHDRYIRVLRNAGIKVPDTVITTRPVNGKIQIVIIQEAFRKDELLRNLVETSSESELLKLCSLIFDDTIKFLKNGDESMKTGFHPTLRNYALHDGSLFYFDTFPPMLMGQKELNRIILRMSPFGSFFKKIIPLTWINLVSDEYYYFDKMFKGIAGSCCRLRPEYADAVLRFGIDYINSSQCSQAEKHKITAILQSPPGLPVLWTFIRKLSGNVGKPNIRKL